MECWCDSLYIVMWGSSVLGRYWFGDFGCFLLWMDVVRVIEILVIFVSLMAESEQGVALAILRGVIDFKREPWPQISDSAKSLVRQMLEPDPKKRLTAEQVLGKTTPLVIWTEWNILNRWHKITDKYLALVSISSLCGRSSHNPE